MPYLICEKCGGYYKLKEGESPHDFDDQCQCGGHLKYKESLGEYDPITADNPQMDDHPVMNDDSITTDDDRVEETLHASDKYLLADNSPKNAFTDSFYQDTNNKEENNEQITKGHLSGNLFRISVIMAIMVIIIITAGILTHKNNSYGVFNFNAYEKYSDEEINTFMESAFNPDDYGNSYNQVGKWQTNVVRIKITGSPTEEDIKTLKKAINDINVNVKDFQLVIDDKNQMEHDMEIYFIPHSEFSLYSVNPKEADGFTLWRVSTSDIYGGNPAGEIFKAKVFIGIDGLSQKRRSHVIVHELAHSLGLHHNHNQNSVLCLRGPDITEYTDLDKTMFRMLYRNDILPYMSRNQVEIIMNNSRRSFF
ncbi:MAG: DUF2927 domain-containing protein [Methanobacteriaceae archaeon]|nr:DUF2927 domain-containing protein [Methanobacteriaceae archaeon]